MVVFTCNHCGDSLQKPKVEKHYLTKCRRDKSLTCVDCMKDFFGEEYDVHKKCITEAERYSAKGSIPTGIIKKGENKQMQWIEMIESIVETETNIPASQKNIFQILSGNNNVPRKKKPFTNFIRSSTGFKANLTDIENVWNIIEKYKEESLKRRAEDKTKENGEKKEETETVEKVVVTEEAMVEDAVKTKKEKKKNKRKSEIVEGVEEDESSKKNENKEDVSTKEEEVVAEEASLEKGNKKKEETFTEETKVEDEVKTKKEKKKNKRKSEIVKGVEEDESSKKNEIKEDVSTKEEEVVAAKTSVEKGNKKKEETVTEETKVEGEVKTKKEKKKNKRKTEIVKAEDEPDKKIKKKEEVSPMEEEVVAEEASVGKANKKKRKNEIVEEETKMEVEEEVPKKEKKKKTVKDDVIKVEAEEESKVEAEEEPAKKKKKEGKSENNQVKKQVEKFKGNKAAGNSSGAKDEIMEKVLSNEKDLTDAQLKLLKQLAEVGPIKAQKKDFFKCIRELNGRNTDKLLSNEVWGIVKKYKITQSKPLETSLKNKKKLLKKHKKEKARKQNGVAQKNGEVNGHEQVANGNVNGEENKAGNKYYSKILEVLNEKNSITLSKLQKKICAKAHETQEEFTPKQLKQFNKTLKKIENVKVEGDMVILST